MCEPETRQIYMFLQSFGEPDSIFGWLNIQSNLLQQSRDYRGDEYFMHLPYDLDDLFEMALEEGLIEKPNPVTWSITDKGIKWKEELYNQYVGPSDKKEGRVQPKVVYSSNLQL